jgi:hypothetical protein
MATYVGLIHIHSDFQCVDFPDFPGLTVTGTNLTLVRIEAHELLIRRVSEMQRRQEPVPPPQPIARIMLDPRSRKAMPLLLRVAPPSWRMRQIS